MFRDAYKSRRVFVTGHTGFKGSWLAVWLKELGAEVTGYSLEPPSKPSNFTACGLDGKMRNIHGDIRDFDSLQAAFSECEPEMVFHLAAQSLVRPSYLEPKETFDTNVGGTVNVLEAVRRTPSVRVVVNVTSDKCYENRDSVRGYCENDPLGGRDPYSASKACAELVFNAYSNSFYGSFAGETPGAASVRAGNVIGGGDWSRDRIIPDCIRALSTGGKVMIRNPRSIRPWQHVMEPLSGYLWLGALLWDRPGQYSGAWNFGPDNSIDHTVGDLVEKFIDLWGDGGSEHRPSESPFHEAPALRLCCDKARRQLGWQSILDIHESLQLTVDWYKQFYKCGKTEFMYKFCSNQIGWYASNASRRRILWALN